MRATTRTAALALLAAGPLLLGGCATITYDAVTLEQMVAMNRVAPPDSYERVGVIEEEKKAIFAAAQLITIRDIELADLLAREVVRAGGDAVINLRLEEEFNFIDFLIGSVSNGLVGTRTVEIRGDIIRWRRQGSLDERAERFLAASCRAVDVEDADGATRAVHVCTGPAAPTP